MRNKILRILGVALVISLLIGLIPLMPAMAAPGQITLSPAQGPPGTTVTVTGTGYSPSSTAFYVWWGTTQIYATGTVNSTGYLTTTFAVPASIPRAQYTIKVTTNVDTTTTYSAYFTVTPTISLSTTTGSVGDQITVYGFGFTASSSVIVYFDSVSQLTTTSTTYGAISATLTIPSCVRGSHTITAIGYSSETAPTVYFNATSKLTVNPTTAAAGDALTISGRGFNASQAVSIYFDDVATGTTTVTDTVGSFSISTYKFPTTYAGTHTIRAQDSSASVSTTVTT